MEPTHWLDVVEQRLSSEALRVGLAMSVLDFDSLWAHCVSLDRLPNQAWLRAVLEGAQPRTAHEHDVVAQALNDSFLDTQQDHPVRYAAQLASTA